METSYRFKIKVSKNSMYFKILFLHECVVFLWIQSDNGEIAVDEAAHLLDSADTDHDDKLTMQEVVDAMEEFLESDATEYGEMLRFHDEL